MAVRRKRSAEKKRRPAIGLLIGRIGDIGFSANVWPGVAAMAEERDANLICFVGGMLNLRQEFDFMRNAVYGLVGPQNVDGLVAMSGSVGKFAGPGALQDLYRRFHPLPVISVGMELEGFPSVLVDNSGGMREAVAHLIEVHGVRRIAFLRGPQTSPEAEERYRAYREVLEEHGLAFDPDLVAEGDFLSVSGSEAISLLLDHRRVSFQAIACANDAMALNAIAALQEHGLRVPDQAAVVGFDDLEEARYVVPPMTTVRQPFTEMGRKAAELLLDRLEGKSIPEKTFLSTELAVRRSCGCMPLAEELPAERGGKKPPAGLRRSSAAQRKKILADIEGLAEGTAAGLSPGWSKSLFDALMNTGRRGKSRMEFLAEWENLLRRVSLAGGDVMPWYRVLDALRRVTEPPRRRGQASSGGPNWRMAELLIGEIAQWAQANRRFRAGWHSLDFLTRINDPLMTAFDVEGLTRAVEHQLPELGVRSCYLSLYEFPEPGGRTAPSEWARLVLAYNEGGRLALEAGGRRFPSRELVPEDILASENRFALVLEALYYRDENQFGFILFGPLRSEVRQLREVMTRQIGTALKGTMLLQEQRRAEEQIRADEEKERAFQERLRTLLEVSSELSRAESVDALCRRAVELGRERLGFDRLSIWFHHPETAVISGSFGTDPEGKLVDERNMTVSAVYAPGDILLQTSPVVLLMRDVELMDGNANAVGRGMRAEAAMWDGEKTIGLVATDNLLRRRPITGQDCELLNLYASTLGNLCTRKRAEEKLRADEEKERAFQERLRTLLEVSNELSRAESEDEMCRQAVELGRSRLGFDRLSIWFHGPDPGAIIGSFGTDTQGRISDERGIRWPTEDLRTEILRQTRPVALFFPDADLSDGKGNTVGRGELAQAAMWNGEEVIGFVSLDNLLGRRPITERDCELLNLYASTLGYLCSRKQAEDALKEYSGHLEEMVADRTRALEAAQESLVRQEKLAVLGQLAATVSHELRNPLATIRVSATDLERKVGERGLGAERPLERIQRNVSRCDNIISELLDYARMPEPNLQPVEIDEWLNRLLDELILPPGIALAREISTGATIAVDPERFRRVIINLVDNARQAMQGDSRGGAEKILTVRAEADADGVTFTVSDTGPGIPAAVEGHLFEPLFSTKGFGVGLGLSIVKGIVEQHGGGIRIASRAGEGARAEVRIPRSRRKENRA